VTWAGTIKRPYLHTYKQLLEAKRSGLLRSLQQTREGVSIEEDGHYVRDVKQREEALERLMRESRLLWIVEAALQGIAEGMYGKCQFCQREIPANVLAAIPWSAYCAHCQKLAEAYMNRPPHPPHSASHTPAEKCTRSHFWQKP
jgi:RNA polymerase-binding transcription factor DksA